MGLGTIAIVAIIGLLFGKVIEATLFEEIAKWALMAVVIAAIMCVIAFVPIQMLAGYRSDLYPKYGKKWFIKGFANSIASLFKKSK